MDEDFYLFFFNTWTHTITLKIGSVPGTISCNAYVIILPCPVKYYSYCNTTSRNQFPYSTGALMTFLKDWMEGIEMGENFRSSLANQQTTILCKKKKNQSVKIRAWMMWCNMVRLALGWLDFSYVICPCWTRDACQSAKLQCACNLSKSGYFSFSISLCPSEGTFTPGRRSPTIITLPILSRESWDGHHILCHYHISACRRLLSHSLLPFNTFLYTTALLNSQILIGQNMLSNSMAVTAVWKQGK